MDDSATAVRQNGMLLVKGADVFAPRPLGRMDILACGKQILKIASQIAPPPGLTVKTIDARGKIVVPGLIDLHVHLLGGGGEGGFGTRMPEIDAHTILAAGVTTVVGCLGTDDITRRLESLLAKALQLRVQGLSAYIYTGSYHVPPPTITGSIRKDLAFLEPVIGVGELAISDHRSSQPTFAEFVRIAAEARTGGMLGGKAGLVHLHVGSGPGHLDLLKRAVDETEIPAGQFLPTHVNRTAELFEKALDYARQGGFIDITAGAEGLSFGLAPLTALELARKAGVDYAQITISSDSNGSMPIFDSRGRMVSLAVGKISVLMEELRRLHGSGMALEQALVFFTTNPARRLGLDKFKGSLGPGMDADMLILDPQLRIDTIIAGGVARQPQT